MVNDKWLIPNPKKSQRQNISPIPLHWRGRGGSFLFRYSQINKVFIATNTPSRINLSIYVTHRPRNPQYSFDLLSNIEASIDAFKFDKILIII